MRASGHLPPFLGQPASRVMAARVLWERAPTFSGGERPKHRLPRSTPPSSISILHDHLSHPRQALEQPPPPQGFALCVWTGSKQGRSVFSVIDCAPGQRCVLHAGRCDGGFEGVAWQARKRKEGRSRTISNLVRRKYETQRPGGPKSRIWLREFHGGFCAIPVEFGVKMLQPHPRFESDGQVMR